MPPIRDVILRQKKELIETQNKPYIKRDVILIEKDKPIIKVIKGPRRAGKRFFAIHELKQVGYINFDDEKSIP